MQLAGQKQLAGQGEVAGQLAGQEQEDLAGQRHLAVHGHLTRQAHLEGQEHRAAQGPQTGTLGNDFGIHGGVVLDDFEVSGSSGAPGSAGLFDRTGGIGRTRYHRVSGAPAGRAENDEKGSSGGLGGARIQVFRQFGAIRR